MKKVTLTNFQIFALTELLNKIITENETKQMTVKLGYYIQRDFSVLFERYKVIAQLQKDIREKYTNENNEINTEAANAELIELSNITEEIELFLLPIDLLDTLELSLEEIQLLSLIISE